MNKKYWIVAVAFLVVVGSIVFVSTLKPFESKGVGTNVIEISISNQGFMPSTVTLKRGATIKWTNYDSSVHQIMPSSPIKEFDPKQAKIEPSQSYQFVADQIGTMTYHDSLYPTHNGQLIIEP